MKTKQVRKVPQVSDRTYGARRCCRRRRGNGGRYLPVVVIRAVHRRWLRRVLYGGCAAAPPPGTQNYFVPCAPFNLGTGGQTASARANVGSVCRHERPGASSAHSRMVLTNATRLYDAGCCCGSGCRSARSERAVPSSTGVGDSSQHRCGADSPRPRESFCRVPENFWSRCISRATLSSFSAPSATGHRSATARGRDRLCRPNLDPPQQR